MLVDGSSGRTPEVAPGAGDEDSAEATQPTTRRVPRPQRIVRALTIALACFTGVGVLHVLVKLRAARRGTARVPSRSAPHAKTRRWLVRAALSVIDLRRRPPHDDTSAGGLAEAVRSLRRPPLPRGLPHGTGEPINPRVGGTIRPWWVEGDGGESHRRWPN